MMKKILVIGPSWIGDMVMAQSLFISLNNKNPDSIIDIVAPEWSIPLLERMPEVNKAISLPVKHKQFGLKTRYQMGKGLEKEKYNQAIVIPRSFKSALIPLFAKIPKRTGYRGEMRYGILNDIRSLDKTVLTQTVQRYVNLGHENSQTQILEIPAPKLTVDKENRARLLEKFQLPDVKPIIGLMPGAEFGSAKKWPYFKELAKLLSEKNYQVWIFGSKKDADFGEKTALQNNSIVNLCGQTELVDVIDLISTCRKIVTNDSGLMHVAAAVNVPLVAIYGSSTPDYTPPLGNKVKVHYLGLDCSPCFKRECPLGHTNCLKMINIEDVINSIDTVS